MFTGTVCSCSVLLCEEGVVDQIIVVHETEPKERRFLKSEFTTDNFRPSGPPDEPFKFVDVDGVWKELAEPPYATVGIQRYAHYRDAF